MHGASRQQPGGNAKQRATLQAAPAPPLLHPAGQRAHRQKVAEHQQRQRQCGEQRPGGKMLPDQGRQRDADDGARPVQGLGRAEHGQLGVATQNHGDKAPWNEKHRRRTPRLLDDLGPAEMKWRNAEGREGARSARAKALGKCLRADRQMFVKAAPQVLGMAEAAQPRHRGDRGLLLAE
ncbi:hypothetical protein SDC9_98130 [bioreactor metagenome]|uniref:Uncharacterized protein n=1 Tax=bioreactor metagenome TaxID=1076179 RepID=A0A645ADU4_9ZZZZ